MHSHTCAIAHMGALVGGRRSVSGAYLLPGRGLGVGDLCSRENIVTEEALNNIECLPVLEALVSEPTLAEIKVALDSLARHLGRITSLLKC